MKGEGLGLLLKNFIFVSLLLFFNIIENFYKKYVMLDLLVGVVMKIRSNIEEEEEDIGVVLIFII